MTVEEIKAAYTMDDILRRYGIHKNRQGFCLCPFHTEKTPSMKIYKDRYYCFGCQRSGDIFTFVEEMDGVSFKEAFFSLGGTYGKPTVSSRLAIYRAQKGKKQKEKENARLEEKKRTNSILIDFYRHQKEKAEPLSDAWCAACKGLEYQLYIHGELNNMPY